MRCRRSGAAADKKAEGGDGPADNLRGEPDHDTGGRVQLRGSLVGVMVQEGDTLYNPD